jgi:hypothetical protein
VIQEGILQRIAASLHSEAERAPCCRSFRLQEEHSVRWQAGLKEVQHASPGSLFF